jgi:adenylate cyclase
MERHLAAVMMADVVGYTRMSQADEEGTRARLGALLQAIFEPKIAEHHGRLVKTMGDGLLVEFPSVVNALRCAVDVQRAIAEHNLGQPPGHKLEFRIGINLGDVIVENGDIHGDGVNIAARLQTLAAPGGIVISGAAYDQVKNRLEIGYQSLGERRVKNVLEPVRAYNVLTDVNRRPPLLPAWRQQWPALAAIAMIVLAAGALGWQRIKEPPPASLPAPAAQPAAALKPSLVVLPFDNLSDDKQQGYLADGITEDLTTELARLPGLFVISRNAAFGYRGKNLAPPQIAQELGVRYVLEGSIRRNDNDVRINAQLIDGKTGGHLWANRFDGDWSQVFSLQDKVLEQIVSALKLQLIAGPKMAEAPGGTDVPAAYDLYLQGYGTDYGKNPEKAAALFKQAVALDPNFGQAWAELAWVYWMNKGVKASEALLGVSGDEMGSKIKELMKEASKNPSPSYYQLVADLNLWQRRSTDAIANAARAIALNPSDQYGQQEMSIALALSGRTAEATDYLKAAERVDPKPTAYRYHLEGVIAFAENRMADAVASLNKVNPQELTDDGTRKQRLYLLVAANALLGRMDEAGKAKEELERLASNPTAHLAMHNLPFEQRADMNRMRDGLSKAGIPRYAVDLPDEDRLGGEQIRSLVFGHTLRGKQTTPTEEPYFRETSADGQARTTIGSSFSDSGTSTVNGDMLCTLWDSDVEVTCLMVFRNPGGTAAQQDEFVLLTPSGRMVEFSQEK